ncbi:MAG: trypsin-like peptidase domain-containing protein [Nitrospira sp.]|nr:trypsin-like peptidase domain-containing protein [Nitrospira sp.]
MKTKILLLGLLPITSMGLGIKFIERDDVRALAYRFESLQQGTPNTGYQLAGKVSGVGWYPGQVLSVTALTPEWIIMARHTKPYGARSTVRFATDDGQIIDRAVDVESVVFPPLMRWSVTNAAGFVSVHSKEPDIALARLKEPLPSSIRPLQIGDAVDLGDVHHIYGFGRYGGLNFGSSTNTVWRLQAGNAEYINDFSYGAVMQTGDSGSPTLDQAGNIVGIHWSAGADVNLTDPQILAWIESIVGRQVEPDEPIDEPAPEDIIVKVRPGQRVIVEGVE